MDLEHKLRFRTQDELKLQEEGLREVCGILREMELPFFLVEGTLLGAVREQSFISWDWDVGISLMTESSLHRLPDLGRRLSQSGFSIEIVARRNPKLNARKYGTKYEMSLWRASGRMRRRRGRKIPRAFFDTPGVVHFYGHPYPCPSPVEDYLEYCYGDWRTPVRSTSTASDSSKTWLRRGADYMRARASRRDAPGHLPTSGD